MRASLLEAYFDAKRLWAEPANIPQHYAIKVLDELAKVLFGALHVTARRKNVSVTSDVGAPYLLLAPLERRALDAVLSSGEKMPDGILKTSIPSEFKDELENRAKEWVNSITHIFPDEKEIQEGYIENIACRWGFLDIDRVIHFEWHWPAKTTKEIYEVFVLFTRSEHAFNDFGFHKREMCLSMAQAFLHGVANFLLRRQSASPPGEVLGYDLSGEAGPASTSSEDTSSTAMDSISVSDDYADNHANTADWWARQPGNASVQMVLPLVTKYRGEYLETLRQLHQGRTGFVDHEELFSLIFLCKLNDGWVWLLDGQQEDKLKSLTPLKGATFDDVWRNFRFKSSGVISHMERKGLLADIVYNPDRELICEQYGYAVDAGNELTAGAFRDIENSFPRIGKASFFYFRLTGHVSKEASRKEKLGPGALVAVFMVPMVKEERGCLRPWQYQAVFRRLAEAWRIKLITLTQLRQEVEQAVTDSIQRQELQNRADAMAGFSHQVGHVIGSKSNFSLDLFREEDIQELSKKALLARFAQIRYSALLPRAFEDALDKPEAVLHRWELQDRSEAYISLDRLLMLVWDELAMPILDVIKDLGSDENSLGCYKRTIRLAGREAAPRQFKVPNLEVLKTALFESLWNAFEHGVFSEEAVVEIAFEPAGTNIGRIVITNPSDGKRHTQREGGKGLQHIRAMIENLAQAANLSTNAERKLSGKCHFECHYDDGMSRWVTAITLGGLGGI